MVRARGLATGTADDLESITGELVANALEHGGGRTVTVACALTARTAVVSVTDEGGGRASVAIVPAAGAPDAERERGRGLLITDVLATRWGTWRASRGLTVWAELDLHPSSESAW
jgi:anti-sigma regulatory factor (Ser/Thr protein kinase)